MRKATHSELLTRQRKMQKMPKLPLTVVVNDIRSLYNVGSIFRTADGAGVEKIWLCGITGIPPSGKISKTALDAEKTVPWEYEENVSEVVAGMAKRGYEIVLLEQTSQSRPFEQYRPSRPVCLVIGNEIQGVGDSLLTLADLAIEIPMAGVKNSLNVTVAFGIVAFYMRTHLLNGGNTFSGASEAESQFRGSVEVKQREIRQKVKHK